MFCLVSYKQAGLDDDETHSAIQSEKIEACDQVGER